MWCSTSPRLCNGAARARLRWQILVDRLCCCVTAVPCVQKGQSGDAAVRRTLSAMAHWCEHADCLESTADFPTQAALDQHMRSEHDQWLTTPPEPESEPEPEPEEAIPPNSGP